MSSHIETIEAFYAAFQRRDHEAMARCYHPSIHFTDPVFTDLHRSEVAAMWHMLCDSGSDLEVTFDGIEADGDTGVRAHWEARYTFGAKRRHVHNKVNATFVFEAGKIIRHVDEFNLWRWTRMALGVTGVYTSWTGLTKSKVRVNARRGLDRFLESHPEYH